MNKKCSKCLFKQAIVEVAVRNLNPNETIARDFLCKECFETLTFLIEVE